MLQGLENEQMLFKTCTWASATCCDLLVLGYLTVLWFVISELQKKLSAETWRCKCAKQSFNSWSECALKGEVFEHVSSRTAVDINIPEPALGWHKLPRSPGRAVTFTSWKAVRAHMPSSSLEINLSLFVFVHKAKKQRYILFCLASSFCLKGKGALLESHAH